MNEIQIREDALYERVSQLIEIARKRVKTTIDITMVYTYYGIGKYIVDDEQQGKERAEYGAQVLKGLSVKLTKRFGAGCQLRLTATQPLGLQCRPNLLPQAIPINWVYSVDPIQKS